MKIHCIGEKNSVFNRFIAEMRDIQLQKDSMRFRRNLERTGEIFAYEISKTLDYKAQEVQTPLGIATCFLPENQIIIASILRAGIPLHNGLLHYFDQAQNAFIAAYRKYGRDNKFTIQIEYMAAPNIDDKVLIITDPMLATGASALLTYQHLLQKGRPKHCHFVSVIASREGVAFLSRQLPKKGVTIWLGAIDEELTIKSYIIPGLGDAGDLAYGEK
ncbi:MAG: uracil phosphoribosyltransferase [Bacteroidales bacterium]|nr:uracil phosphoribosyltransferase [Bacteroidales bacterium]MCL2738946.1 uracil phosphoribosyltransferase [Bacteroidales bacterium]